MDFIIYRTTLPKSNKKWNYIYKTIHIQGNSMHIRSFSVNQLKDRGSQQYPPYVRSEWISHKPDAVYHKRRDITGRTFVEQDFVKRSRLRRSRRQRLN